MTPCVVKTRHSAGHLSNISVSLLEITLANRRHVRIGFVSADGSHVSILRNHHCERAASSRDLRDDLACRCVEHCDDPIELPIPARGCPRPPAGAKKRPCCPLSGNSTTATRARV